MSDITTTDYKRFISEIKSKIQQSQIKAAISVNVEMLKLYWFIGSSIVKKQKESNWGSGFIKQMSKDLKDEFPNMKGFSDTNLKYMRSWYIFFSKSPQVVGDLANALIFQIPWGQNREIITKSDSVEEAFFYVQKTIENSWSRNILIHQIESGLYERNGKSITNFKTRLPASHSDLAKQILKDPYNFDFLTMREKYDEKELEDALVSNITDFLLELGVGFSYLGKQYKLTVDDILKAERDNPTIGLLICKEKKKTIVEYALKDMSKPLGISEYLLTKQLPDEYKSSLPSIEEIEREIGGGDE